MKWGNRCESAILWKLRITGHMQVINEPLPLWHFYSLLDSERPYAPAVSFFSLFFFFFSFCFFSFFFFSFSPSFPPSLSNRWPDSMQQWRRATLVILPNAYMNGDITELHLCHSFLFAPFVSLEEFLNTLWVFNVFHLNVFSFAWQDTFFLIFISSFSSFYAS